MVEIPEPYVRGYPLIAIKKEDLLELYSLFRSAPLEKLTITINITVRGSSYVMSDGPAGEGAAKLEQELQSIIHNREKFITGFFIEAAQSTDGPQPRVSISLKLSPTDAKLSIIKPRTITDNDMFTLNGIEESVSKILARKHRLADRIIDSPYTAAISTTIIAALAYTTAESDKLNQGAIAGGIILLIWLANKIRAYRMGHAIFDENGEDSVIRIFNRVLKKYGREIMGGAITLCISLIMLFINWIFHLV